MACRALDAPHRHGRRRRSGITGTLATVPTVTIQSAAEIAPLEERVVLAAEHAAISLRDHLQSGQALDVLRAIRFSSMGRHPGSEEALNLIEQVNQTFTYLVSFRAMRHLLAAHPAAGPWKLNLGTAAGFDIESRGLDVLAEVFAAVHPTNNRKLAKDVARLAKTRASHRYVFFHSPGFVGEQPGHGTVKVIALDLAALGLA